MTNFQIFTHALERMYPQLHGCSAFLIALLTIMLVSVAGYLLTRWTEWNIAFMGAFLFALPFLFRFAY